MKNLHPILIVCLLFTPAAPAATTRPATKPAPPGPQITRLTLHPVPTTRPALKYELLPNVVDQTPGNAAQLYLTSIEISEDLIGEQFDQIDHYLKEPLSQLPKEKVSHLLETHKSALRFADLAARREYCRWEMPFRQEGYKTLLPQLNYMHGLTRLIALQAKLQIAQNNWIAAGRALQNGLAMAHDLNDQAVIVQLTVAWNNAKVMLNRVEEWVGRPDAPNLYWPLTDLPHPFLDPRMGMQWGSAEFYFSIPMLDQARHGHLTSDQWRKVEQDIWNVLQYLAQPLSSPPFPGGNLTFEQYIAMAQPHAKAWLIAAGRPRQKVEAMDAYQAVGMYWLDTYRDWSDELRRGWSLPYWQAAAQLHQSAHEFQIAKKSSEGDLILELVPVISRARMFGAQLDRQIALLRTVEALRDYAARHDGQPPAALSDIQNLPIPIDPMTGKPFGYHATGRSAVLEAPPPPYYPYEGRRYELTFE